MSVEEILKEIEGGLTGEIKKDMDYLQVCLKRYNKHEDIEERKAIVRGIQGMMFKVSPQETEKFARMNMSAMQQAYKEILDKALAYSRARDAEKVIETLEPVIKKIEAEDVYKDDDETEYVVFAQPMEKAVYSYKFKNDKKTYTPIEPLPDFYYLYGVAKKVQGDNDGAIDALQKAIRWDPVACGIYLELADYIRESGDTEKFMELTEKAYEYAYLPGDLARCYSAFGRFYFERGRMETAIACMQMSFMLVKENPFAKILFNELQKNVEADKLKPLKVEEVAETLRRNNLPDQPDKDIVGIAYTYASKYAEAGNPNASAYYYQIVYGLTRDDKIKALLDEQEKAIEEKKTAQSK